jgi:hypothetical protein
LAVIEPLLGTDAMTSSPKRVLVCDAVAATLSSACAPAVLSVDEKIGMTPDELESTIGEYEAVVVARHQDPGRHVAGREAAEWSSCAAAWVWTT